MPIARDTLTEIAERMVSDLILSVNSGQLDTSKQIDPTILNSYVRGIVEAIAGGIDSNNDLSEQVLTQIFIQTATDEFLGRWGVIFGITRQEAKKATGTLSFTGSSGGIIPIGATLTRSDGEEYITTSSGTITSQTINISSITRAGTLATVTTTSNHNLATGQVLDSIQGVDQPEYNLSNITISVISNNQFTYQVTGSPTTPATGTITATEVYTFVPIQSSDFGALRNSGSGSVFTLVSPIANVDDSAIVTFEGVTGGLDIESDINYRARILERTSNFTAPFTKSGIPIFIKQFITGITRVWINEATPSAGSTEIYFVRDNDINIIPTSQQLVDTKDLIINGNNLTDGIKPANMPDANVYVLAPTAVPVNFVFSGLSPNTTDMQTAITNSLTDFFKSDQIVLSEDVLENEYTNAIFNTLDSNGNVPVFALTTPTGDITINTGELATLGNITFP
jgi:uncharacterized phage protein gp47/JayE